MKLGIAVLPVLVLLSGCVNTDAVMLDTSQHFDPTESVVILVEEPERPHEAIAIIEGNGSLYNNQASVIKAIQKKARKIGAHAILLMSSESDFVPTTYMTNIDGSMLTIPAGNKQTVKAMAIRYVD